MRHTLKKLKILVLGGSGFIGNAVIPELLSRGHKVVATYCNHQPFHKAAHAVTWIAWDATTEALPYINWSDINVALYLTNYPDLWKFPSNAKPLYYLMVESVFSLLEKAYMNKINRVVIASTGDVLSNNVQIATEEDVHYAPRSFYGTVKACAELITNAYSNVMSTFVLRFFHPYGPGGDRFLINRLAIAVKEGKEISIEGEDGIIISPVHLSDLARGTALAVESMAKGIFHLCGPDRMSLRCFLGLTGKLVGRQPNVKSISGEIPGGHAGLYVRAEELLGFSPLISLETGIKDILGLT
jgi:nucleoside-diphosphate-sugar epimerase